MSGSVCHPQSAGTSTSIGTEARRLAARSSSSTTAAVARLGASYERHGFGAVAAHAGGAEGALRVGEATCRGCDGNGAGKGRVVNKLMAVSCRDRYDLVSVRVCTHTFI